MPAEWYLEIVWKIWYGKYGVPTAQQFAQLVMAIDETDELIAMSLVALVADRCELT